MRTYHSRALCVATLAILCMSSVRPSAAEIAVPDDELTIPAENSFDGFQIEGINEVKLYPQFPEDWPKQGLAGKWRMQLLQAPKPAEPEPLQPDLFDTDAGDDDEEDDGEKEDEKAAFKVEEGKPIDLSRDFLEQAAKQMLAAENAEKYRWDEGGKQPLAPGRYLFLTTFELDGNLTPPQRSCLLSFERMGHCIFYVNGKKALDHRSSWAPFTIDITKRVKPGKNIVAVSTLNSGVYRGVRVLAPPLVYAKRVLTNTDTDTNTLSLDLWLINNGAAPVDEQLSAEIRPWQGDGSVTKGTVTRKLAPGENRVSWDIKMDRPACWSPESPHLYELRLRDTRGNLLARERFGFRTLRAKGKHFYLNGRKYVLLGCQWNSIDYHRKSTAFVEPLKPGEPPLTFNKRYHYAWLKVFKTAGMNCVRTHSDTGFRSRALFEACDEVGIIHYADWNTWRQVLQTPSDSPAENMAGQLARFEEWLYYQYNHPSTALISFGNERYQALPENLNVLHDHIKGLDKQGRPLCSSSGRIRHQLNMNRPIKDKIDFADDHSYFGTMKGSWLYNRSYFRRLKKDLDACYGKDAVPLVNFECMALPCMRYGNDKLSAKVNRIVTADKVDKKAYLGVAQMAPRYGWEVVIRFPFSQDGLRVRYTDEVAAHDFAARAYRRQIELFRQEDILQGVGGHMAPMFLPYAFGRRNSLAYVKKQHPKLVVKALGIDIDKREFVKTPGFHMLKRVYSPELICAKWFDRNLIAGAGAIEADIYAINDSARDGGYSARVLFRDGGGRTLHGQSIDFGSIEAGNRKVVSYRHSIPAELATGFCRLEMFLFRDGKRVGDNYYDVYVFSADDVRPGITSDKSIAVYEASAEGATKAVLDRLKLRYDALDKFDGLGDCQVLILGANSIDEKVVKQGERIRLWVEAGGRLLSFEQSRTGPLPWLTEMKVMSAAATESADLVDHRHPAFAGLSQKNLDTWSGNGILYRYVLSPLNESVVAIGAAGYIMRDGYLQSALSDAVVGKGIAVMSQFGVVERYGKDSVATVLANNLVRYILSDEKGHSHPVTGEKVIVLDEKDCVPIDLRPHFNSSFIDEKPGDGKGGWDDWGSENDLRNMAVGKQILAGVPFVITDPRKNNDRSCIILRHPRLRHLPDRVDGIKVEDTFSSLYFLHTATHCRRGEGDPVYRFVVRYADGEQEDVFIIRGIHVADWTHPRAPLAGSTLAWSGLSPKHGSVGVFYTKWDNPRPNEEIASIDFVTEEKVVAVLIAITGYKKDREEGWR